MAISTGSISANSSSHDLTAPPPLQFAQSDVAGKAEDTVQNAQPEKSASSAETKAQERRAARKDRARLERTITPIATDAALPEVPEPPGMPAPVLPAKEDANWSFSGVADEKKTSPAAKAPEIKKEAVESSKSAPPQDQEQANQKKSKTSSTPSLATPDKVASTALPVVPDAPEITEKKAGKANRSANIAFDDPLTMPAPDKAKTSRQAKATSETPAQSASEEKRKRHGRNTAHRTHAARKRTTTDHQSAPVKRDNPEAAETAPLPNKQATKKSAGTPRKPAQVYATRKRPVARESTLNRWISAASRLLTPLPQSSTAASSSLPHRSKSAKTPHVSKTEKTALPTQKETAETVSAALENPSPTFNTLVEMGMHVLGKMQKSSVHTPLNLNRSSGREEVHRRVFKALHSERPEPVGSHEPSRTKRALARNKRELTSDQTRVIAALLALPSKEVTVMTDTGSTRNSSSRRSLKELDREGSRHLVDTSFVLRRKTPNPTDASKAGSAEKPVEGRLSVSLSAQETAVLLQSAPALLANHPELQRILIAPINTQGIASESLTFFVRREGALANAAAALSAALKAALPDTDFTSSLVGGTSSVRLGSSEVTLAGGYTETTSRTTQTSQLTMIMSSAIISTALSQRDGSSLERGDFAKQLEKTLNKRHYAADTYPLMATQQSTTT